MIEPLKDMLVIEERKEAKEVMTAGGIYLQDGELAGDNFLVSIVREVGPLVTDIKVGDEIIVDKFEIIPVTINRRQYTLCSASRVLGKWKNDGIVSVET
jgi:co-chaperonin GroES (HSP10)